jgi:hypothetical protein
VSFLLLAASLIFRASLYLLFVTAKTAAVATAMASSFDKVFD